MSMFLATKPAAAVIAALTLCATAAPVSAASTIANQVGISPAAIHQGIKGSSTAQVVEQRNFLLTQDIITNEGTVPAGTRVSSYLVAISSADAGSISFRTPVLAVIPAEQSPASTYGSATSGLGQAEFNYASLSNLAMAENASFSASGKALNYQLTNASNDPVIVRVITAAVPEPGTWAMFIAGFGLIGAQLRRRAHLAAQ